MDIHYKLSIRAQPTESTCGPTCLHSIYNYHDDSCEIEEVIGDIVELESGGVMGAQLGLHAQKRGYDVCVYTHNLKVFDPTWFELPKDEIKEKLKLQMLTDKEAKVKLASQLYIDFLDAGGDLKLETLSTEFLKSLLKKGGPLITGLSATYLYRSKREHGSNCDFDDVKGEPQGHFVVITGLSENGERAWIADPHEHNPVAEGQHYSVATNELINSILVGVITYDANLIFIEPPRKL